MEQKDGVDGYILKLVTGGKTYTQKITDATVSEFTFSQKVTKSCQSKAASVTEVERSAGNIILQLQNFSCKADRIEDFKGFKETLKKR